MQKILNINYSVTKDGKIFSHKNGKFLKPFKNKPKGYLRFSTFSFGIKKDFYVHIIVAKTFLENPKNLPFVNHIDGNKTNNNLNNLEWVTASQNTLHAYKIGTKKGMFGENHPGCTLSSELVFMAREEFKNDTLRGSKTRLAKKYNISITHMCRILSGQSRSSDLN